MSINASAFQRNALISGGIFAALGFAAATYAANGNDKGAAYASSWTSMRDHQGGIIMTGIGGLGMVMRSARWSLSNENLWSKSLGRGVGYAVGVTAGVLGAKLLDHHVFHRGWYEDSRKEAEQELENAQTYFEARGVKSDAIGELPIGVDRTLHNAVFMPSDFGGERILIGRFRNGESYTKSPDVVYHEYSHRVVDHYAPGLGHTRESGAIQEGLADAFAAAIEGENWTIGEGGGNEPLRTLDDPASAGQPATRADIINTSKDGGGVHLNATIVGHAEYLIAQRIGADAMVDVTLKALENGRVSGPAGFETLANEMRKAALQLWGHGTNGYVAVDEAWSAVGYGPGAASPEDKKVTDLMKQVFPQIGNQTQP